MHSVEYITRLTFADQSAESLARSLFYLEDKDAESILRRYGFAKVPNESVDGLVGYVKRALGYRANMNPTILFVIDTSGSMSYPEIQGTMHSEIERCYTDIPSENYYYCTSDKPDSLSFNLGVMPFEVGRGPTEFGAVFANLNNVERNLHYTAELVIIFTDGYIYDLEKCHLTNRRTQVIWAVPEVVDFNNIPFGEVYKF